MRVANYLALFGHLLHCKYYCAFLRDGHVVDGDREILVPLGQGVNPDFAPVSNLFAVCVHRNARLNSDWELCPVRGVRFLLSLDNYLIAKSTLHFDAMIMLVIRVVRYLCP